MRSVGHCNSFDWDMVRGGHFSDFDWAMSTTGKSLDIFLRAIGFTPAEFKMALYPPGICKTVFLPLEADRANLHYGFAVTRNFYAAK